ncbi:hypothetical protein MCY_00023, partial [Bartonella rattimassiliensis 15908]
KNVDSEGGVYKIILHNILIFLCFYVICGAWHLRHVEQNAIGLPIHGLVLKRHLLKHPISFHDGAHEWYSDKAIEHPPSLPL